jgi:hypothetical protein
MTKDFQLVLRNKVKAHTTNPKRNRAGKRGGKARRGDHGRSERTTPSEALSRVHQVLHLTVYGRDNHDRPVEALATTVTLYTRRNNDGIIESVHDRLKRFSDEASSGVAADAPSYKLNSVKEVA